MTSTIAKLTVVCPDWGLGHPPKVLEPGDPTQPASHGMCPECSLFLEAAETSSSLEELGAYRRYLLSPLDPRD